MWTCQRCTMENAPTATHCEMCYLDRSAETNPTEWWQCSNCGVFNFAELGKCAQCNHPPGGFSLGATADGNGRHPDVAKIPKDSGLEASDECRERDTSWLQEEAARQCVAAPVLSTAAPGATSLSETAVSSAAKTEEAATLATLQQMHLYDQTHLLQDGEILDFPDRECRVVLVGKTGNGKSATANTILGLDKRFATSFQFGSLTRKCQRHSGYRFGISMEVVDTPGVFDTKLDAATITTEITKCVSIIAPGPHAILLVLRIGVRFTQEEGQAVEEVHRMFGAQLLRFLVIVFTHGDELNDCSESEKEKAIKDMLDGAPDKLKDLLSQANHRYVIFDNKASED